MEAKHCGIDVPEAKRLKQLKTRTILKDRDNLIGQATPPSAASP